MSNANSKVRASYMSAPPPLPLPPIPRKKVKPVKKQFKRYIYKVLKEVHPELTISEKAMAVMDSMVLDLFERFATEAKKLMHMTKKKTLGKHEIQTAVRLVLPGELAKHAVSGGVKATTMFNKSNKQSS